MRGEKGGVRRAELTSAAIQGAGFHVSLGPGQEMLTLQWEKAPGPSTGTRVAASPHWPGRSAPTWAAMGFHEARPSLHGAHYPTPQHSRGLQTAIHAKRTFPVQNTNLALGEQKPQKPVTGGSEAPSAPQPLSQLA